MSHRDDATTHNEKTGRNDPCPCGSGNKYKHCCYGKQGDNPQARTELNSLTAEIRQMMLDREFGSLEEAQAFLDAHIARKNRTPRDNFQGLSPDQMHRFLQFPFSSPELVAISGQIATPPRAPVMRLFDLLLAAVREKGLKTTATGNLPVKFLRQAADEYFFRDNKLPFEIRTEIDFIELHIVRLLSGLAGLVRKYKGRFVMTGALRKLLKQGGTAAVYPVLFHNFAQKYNWAFPDGYPALPIIQQSFVFSLYLFHRFGNEWKPSSFYSDCFIKAFPSILTETASQLTYKPPADIVDSCYNLRCLERFAAFFGLIDIEYEGTDRFDRKFKLKTTALLDEAVTFHFQALESVKAVN